MTRKEYKTACGQLRRCIKGEPQRLGDFQKVERNHTWYIYNHATRNIIAKWQFSSSRRLGGVQYRAASRFWPVLARIADIHFVNDMKSRTVASPYMANQRQRIRYMVHDT